MLRRSVNLINTKKLHHTFDKNLQVFQNSNMVKTNLSSSIAAVTALAAFSTSSTKYNHAPLHVEAFTTNVKPAYIPRVHEFSTISLSTLASSVVDETAPSTTSEDPSFKGTGQVVARAGPYSFIPSANGKSGIIAIKLKVDQDILPPIAQAQVQVKQEIEIPEESNKSTESKMFGGISFQAKIDKPNQSKKSSQGEDFIGKAVVFEDGRKGTVIAQRPPMAFVLCDFGEWDGDFDINSDSISILKERSSFPVSDNLFGSIVDCYGNLLSTTGSTQSFDTSIDRAIFAPIPKISDIALINSPLLSGSAIVDALAPIGKGQNMLVIGQDTGVGQRDLMIGAIKTQVNSKGARCIYAITSDDKKVKDEIIQKLKDADVLDDIVVVCARDNVEATAENMKVTNSAEAITVAASACSIGEALALAKGEDTFVVVDDIDQHKAFWDWTTRVLVDIYGVDSVVKDDKSGGASSEMRAFYSSLIQRAARFKQKNGGGSMTLALLTNLQGQFGSNDEEDVVFSADDFAESSEKVKQRIALLVNKNIPLNAANLRKIQIPLPSASESEYRRRLALQHADDLISMSDGQIWLDETLYNQGQRPALDAQRSITRVGIGADTMSRADAPAMRNLAGGLRFDFAQADSLDGAGANSGADKQILKKNAYLLAMHQDSGEERLLSENCVTLLAASMGVLDDIVKAGGTAGTDVGKSTIANLLSHARETAPVAMNDIDGSLDLSDSVREELEKVIRGYFS